MNVYKVTTALKEIDNHGWKSYKVLAEDMKEAMEKTLKKCDKDEKLDEVKFLMRIDIE